MLRLKALLWIYLGWMVWVALLAYAVVLWVSAFRHSNGGVRILATSCAFTFTVILALTAPASFPKLHLLWAAPVIYFGAMTIAGNIIDSKIKTAPKRADEESKRTGEPSDAILNREYERLGYGAETAEPSQSE